MRASYESERKRREKELRERHQAVQLRRQMLDRMKQRENLRHQLANSNKPDSPTQNMLNSMSQKSLQLEKIENRNKINIFENAFRKIKDATGVSDVNEVIHKITSQESTTENLISVTRENQGKIEALNELRKKIKLNCEELKYSGVGGGQHRKIVDSYEDQLANSATRLERSKLKYERHSKVIISMKAGVGHLQDKLESFLSEINGKLFVINDETVAEALRECDVALTNLMKRIQVVEDDAKRAHITESTSNNSNSDGTTFEDTKPSRLRLNVLNSVDEIDVTSSKINTLRPYNQRIDLNFDEDIASKLVNGANSYDDSNTMNDNSFELDDEELTRDKVKRASSQILLAMDKKKKKPKKKGVIATNSNDAEN